MLVASPMPRKHWREGLPVSRSHRKLRLAYTRVWIDICKTEKDAPLRPRSWEERNKPERGWFCSGKVLTRDYLRYPLGRATVPKVGNSASRRLSVQYLMRSGKHLLGIASHQAVRSYVQGDRTFRAVPYRETGYSKRRSFFLDSARIGYDQRGVTQQT